VEDRDEMGRTPLMIAVKYGRIQTAQELLILGADLSSKDSEGKGVSEYAERASVKIWVSDLQNLSKQDIIK